MTKLTIYTDGGCLGYHHPEAVGSWAYVVFHGYDLEYNGKYDMTGGRSLANTTNNRTELMAVINAVRDVKKEYGIDDLHIRLYSDSGYVVKGINDPSYSKKWMQNGWKTSKKEPVENQDLWIELIAELAGVDITLTNIRGHGKNKNADHNRHNDVCDKMCTALINEHVKVIEESKEK